MLKLNLFICVTSLLLKAALLEPPPVPSCEYEHETRRYTCKNIVNTFPSKFYGNFHLQCAQCHIPQFTNATFPFPDNALFSFNLSSSGVRALQARALSVLSKVQYIYLQDNEIADVEPEAFAGLRQVFELHLQRNRLASLQRGSFADLEANMVDLSRNRIAEVAGRAFEGLRGLLSLDLSRNRIRTLHADSFRGLEGLEVLGLGANRLCSLPLGLFSRLRALRELDLSANRLEKFAVGTFSGLGSVYGLSLANNSISAFDGSVLLPLSMLSKLDISGNGIYYLDASAVHLNVPSIRVLRIDDNPFYCKLLISIVQYFKKINVEVVSMVGRYNVQNINGIACSDRIVDFPIKFDDFLSFVSEEAKKHVNYC